MKNKVLIYLWLSIVFISPVLFAADVPSTFSLTAPSAFDAKKLAKNVRESSQDFIEKRDAISIFIWKAAQAGKNSIDVSTNNWKLETEMEIDNYFTNLGYDISHGSGRHHSHDESAISISWGE